jgi:hypothetical protein
MSQNNTIEDVSTQRIAISTKGVEIDSSQGDLVSEAVLLGTIVVVVAMLYVGKKWIDRKFK